MLIIWYYSRLVSAVYETQTFKSSMFVSHISPNLSVIASDGVLSAMSPPAQLARSILLLGATYQTAVLAYDGCPKLASWHHLHRDTGGMMRPRDLDAHRPFPLVPATRA